VRATFSLPGLYTTIAGYSAFMSQTAVFMQMTREEGLLDITLPAETLHNQVRNLLRRSRHTSCWPNCMQDHVPPYHIRKVLLHMLSLLTCASTGC